jgi:hypothetical protein
MSEHSGYDVWRDVRRKVLDTLHVAAPGMDFESKVQIAEDAAREVAEEVERLNSQTDKGL